MSETTSKPRANQIEATDWQKSYGGTVEDRVIIGRDGDKFRLGDQSRTTDVRSRDLLDMTTWGHREYGSVKKAREGASFNAGLLKAVAERPEGMTHDQARRAYFTQDAERQQTAQSTRQADAWAVAAGTSTPAAKDNAQVQQSTLTF